MSDSHLRTEVVEGAWMIFGQKRTIKATVHSGKYAFRRKTPNVIGYITLRYDGVKGGAVWLRQGSPISGLLLLIDKKIYLKVTHSFIFHCLLFLCITADKLQQDSTSRTLTRQLLDKCGDIHIPPLRTTNWSWYQACSRTLTYIIYVISLWHQRATLLHCVTCPLMTYNLGTLVYFQ